VLWKGKQFLAPLVAPFVEINIAELVVVILNPSSLYSFSTA
jgi:hypothetical protein